ncbi:DUF4396 domain-containing protein [Rhizobium halophytocola]|uniref:DUF4396 domain-containing protein n=1 Tax=Rhizobium halophytocola TaxID=735519 RepID=A0ABS4DW17_9HYPH|nr:DUF4396 domain-containing protein [Rhizobium halophytocola]MBP1849885.1 hypothetical protein [Rhizobium halophytocola]
MFPLWFRLLSSASLLLAVACAVFILLDLSRRPQPMRIMNVVWPVCALFGSIFLLVFYCLYGRAKTRPSLSGASAGTTMSHAGMQGHASGHRHHRANQRKAPFPIAVAKGALHCGSGCMLGDLAAEWLAFALPGIAVAFGWQWLFADKTFAVWILDFLFAFVLGIVFQYFAIVPMRGLSFREGVREAVKADALSLISWQVGMYGAMAIFQFWLLPDAFGSRAEVNQPSFWFIMQIAMLAGFVTAYPVNWWLIRKGVKEAM